MREHGPPTWDLTVLYPKGPTDPGIEVDVRSALDAAGLIDRRLRQAIAARDPRQLAEAMVDFERCRERLHRASTFAFLNWCGNVVNPQGAALLRRIEEAEATVLGTLSGFEADWCRLDPNDATPLLTDPLLRRWRGMLSSLREFSRPLLRPREEELLAAIGATSGPAAWLRLYGRIVSELTVRVDGDPLGLPQARARLRHPDAGVRREATNALAEALAPHRTTFAAVLGATASHRAFEDRLRGFASWDAHRHIENRVRAEEVRALESAVADARDVLHRWNRTRARLLGRELEGLDESDLLAPMVTAGAPVRWTDARDLVLRAYRELSPGVGAIASRFFDGFIDAAPRLRRHVGAFAHEAVPSAHPFVFMSFTGTPADVSSLAHELGHGVHQVLAGERGFFGSVVAPPLAEVASTFGEILICTRLAREEVDPAGRAAVLGQQVDGLADSIFRPILYREFERRIHGSHRAGVELSPEFVDETWIRVHEEWLGDTVRPTQAFRSWWAMVRSFVRSPGATYSYTYGGLIALLLYDRWRTTGPAVADAFVELLRAGGTDSPGRLLRSIGIDTADPATWSDALSVVTRLVAETEVLTHSVHGEIVRVE